MFKKHHLTSEKMLVFVAVFVVVLAIIFITGCKPVVRTSSEKFLTPGLTREIFLQIGRFFHTGKPKEAAQLFKKYTTGGSFNGISTVLRAPLESGTKGMAKVKVFFESYVEEEIAAVHDTLMKISDERKTTKLGNLMDTLSEQVDKTQDTYKQRQMIIDALDKSVRKDEVMGNYIDSDIKTLEGVEQWASSTSVALKDALHSYVANNKELFSNTKPLAESLPRGVYNKWIAIEEKLTKIRQPGLNEESVPVLVPAALSP